jgi:hypothetical protein
LVGTIFSSLLAQAEEFGNAKVAADFGAGLSSHQGIVSTRELALRFAGIAFVEFARDHESEHPVPKEFQPLVTVFAHAGMGQCALIRTKVRGRVTELVPDEGLDVSAHSGLPV